VDETGWGVDMVVGEGVEIWGEGGIKGALGVRRGEGGV
jgi:hypothetical protein